MITTVYLEPSVLISSPPSPEQIRSERPSRTPHALTLNDPNKQLRRHQTTFGGATQGRRICIDTEEAALAGQAGRRDGQA